MAGLNSQSKQPVITTITVASHRSRAAFDQALLFVTVRIRLRTEREKRTEGAANLASRSFRGFEFRYLPVEARSRRAVVVRLALKEREQVIVGNSRRRQVRK